MIPLSNWLNLVCFIWNNLTITFFSPFFQLVELADGNEVLTRERLCCGLVLFEQVILTNCLKYFSQKLHAFDRSINARGQKIDISLIANPMQLKKNALGWWIYSLKECLSKHFCGVFMGLADEKVLKLGPVLHQVSAIHTPLFCLNPTAARFCL